MTVAIIAAAVMLTAAALLALTRMTLGPTTLDRIISLDVITAIGVGGIAIEAILNQHSSTIPILVVLALVGFIGSTTVARFAAGPRRDDD
ncbi:cation:proton antiporter [Phytoactinopolyspora alkaliphila]|uniref:Cation:proton antiporter n=1 Tax=Phytoactinopolyspora alkaliphila TaxID=1783498 RepID=A0A6N9YJB6_9ACTN|nr:monovalent cation/H+ antiporter complex subunit F [Phytoactinopolyspora alkaliphila]NED95047.1 cation:proton antiporter [Phytoactinopolyspora alkaliphila]